MIHCVILYGYVFVYRVEFVALTNKYGAVNLGQVRLV